MRRGFKLGVVVAALAVPVAVCSDGGVFVGERGSGKLVTETREVSGFSGVVLQGSGEVNIEVTGEESLTIEAEDNLMPFLTSDVVNGRLVLGMTKSITPTKDIVYTITVVSLEHVSIEGSGNVIAPDVEGRELEASISGSGEMVLDGLDIGHLNLSISGSGEINATGESERIELSIPGSGSYSGATMVAGTGQVDISGSGRAVVNVTERLNVTIGGSGSVRYYGDPDLDSDVTGSGSITQAK